MNQKEKFNKEMCEMGVDWDWDRQQAVITNIPPYEQKIKEINGVGVFHCSVLIVLHSQRSI